MNKLSQPQGKISLKQIKDNIHLVLTLVCLATLVFGDMRQENYKRTHTKMVKVLETKLDSSLKVIDSLYSIKLSISKKEIVVKKEIINHYTTLDGVYISTDEYIKAYEKINIDLPNPSTE